MSILRQEKPYRPFAGMAKSVTHSHISSLSPSLTGGRGPRPTKKNLGRRELEKGRLLEGPETRDLVSIRGKTLAEKKIRPSALCAVVGRADAQNEACRCVVLRW